MGAFGDPVKILDNARGSLQEIADALAATGFPHLARLASPGEGPSLLAVAVHIVTSLQLWNLKRAARPIAYVKKDDVPSAYAARTMMWSGPIIAVRPHREAQWVFHHAILEPCPTFPR